MTKNPNASLLKEIKASYIITQIKTNKYDESIKLFESKIKPGNADAEANFELGKYYYDNEKIEEAEKTLQQAVKLDPYHANSHFYLAAIALVNDSSDAFVFSCLRFLSLAQKGKRTETILPFLFSKMKMKTGIKSKSGSTSYNDSYILRDEENEIVYKSENPMTDLIGGMLADMLSGNITMDKKTRNDTSAVRLVNELFNVNKTNVEIFQKELKVLCDTAGSNKMLKGDFYRSYYVPYFSDMINNSQIEAFSYLVNSMRREEEYIETWLRINKDKIDRFNLWNKNYQW